MTHKIKSSFISEMKEGAKGKIAERKRDMKNTYCLFQIIKFITEYTNVQQVIITQILLKQFN